MSIAQQGFTIVGDATWRVVVDLGGADGTGLSLEFVSYRRVDTRQQLADVIGGQIIATMDNMPPYVPQVKAGKVRAIAVSTTHRSPAVPDVPTVAEAGGWGPGFRDSMGTEFKIVNFARNGRSSKSFRDEGSWTKVLAAKADYVVIQFGHNDEPGKGPDRETVASGSYRQNLERFLQEVRAQGGKPVLVSSIVRRNLTEQGKVKADSLVPYVQEVRKLAAAKKVPLLDMYSLTLAACESAGPEGCHAWNAVASDGSPDTTHLGEKGKREAGRLAALEFRRVVLGSNRH
mgnify:CR=1 FL=1